MNDFERLLEAHPDDWDTRIVYADWLEENGDEDAAFFQRRVERFRCVPPMQVRWNYARLRMTYPRVVFTGSRAIGGWTDRSDWDLVIEGDSDVAVQESIEVGSPRDEEYFESRNKDVFSVRRELLNIIIEPRLGFLDLWVEATSRSIGRAGGRAGRVKIFKEVFAAGTLT